MINEKKYGNLYWHITDVKEYSEFKVLKKSGMEESHTMQRKTVFVMLC